MAVTNLPPLGKLPSQETSPAPVDKKLEKVTKGEAVIKKKTLGDKFAEAFVTSDIESVKAHIIKEVIIPGIKRLFYNAICDGLAMFFEVDEIPFFRRTGGSSSYYQGGGYDYAKISTYGKHGTGNNSRNDTTDSNTRADYRGIIYATKEDANEVLSSLQELSHPDQYGQASLADLYDLAGITVSKQSFVDNRYGWKWEHLAHVKIHRVSHGWVLDLPAPIVID